jgi:hypothetical protein
MSFAEQGRELCIANNWSGKHGSPRRTILIDDYLQTPNRLIPKKFRAFRGRRIARCPRAIVRRNTPRCEGQLHLRART